MCPPFHGSQVGYGKNGNVRWMDAAYMSGSGMMFAAAGTKLGQRMNKNGLKSKGYFVV